MRLTTRLMQVASWLLLQRAVNEGELTRTQALAERHRVKLSRQDLGCPPEVYEELPATLRDLSRRSLRVQERVIHLDRSLAIARSPEPTERHREIALQPSVYALRFRPDGRTSRRRPSGKDGSSEATARRRRRDLPQSRFWPHWSAR